MNNGGISFVGLLTIIFVGLKLTGHINWSWWWVCSPILIYYGTALILLAILGAVVMSRRKK